MSLYAAIDLHSNNSVLAIIDAGGTRVHRARLANELPLILRALEPWRESIQGIAVESTYN